MVNDTAGKNDEPPRSSRNDALTVTVRPRFARAPRMRPQGSCSRRATRSWLPAESSAVVQWENKKHRIARDDEQEAFMNCL